MFRDKLAEEVRKRKEEKDLEDIDLKRAKVDLRQEFFEKKKEIKEQRNHI